MTKPDLSKTQFLIEQGPFVTTSRMFKRKRDTALFNKDGQFQRLITQKEFWALKQAHPNEVAKDGLYTTTIWTLVPIKAK